LLIGFPFQVTEGKNCVAVVKIVTPSESVSNVSLERQEQSVFGIVGTSSHHALFLKRLHRIVPGRSRTGNDSAAFAGQRIINLARAIHLVRGADVADDAVFGKVGEMVVVAPTRKRIKYDLEKNAGAADGA
jgi:ABC-type microcin C transport system duplicated ATPase subunit YejF